MGVDFSGAVTMAILFGFLGLVTKPIGTTSQASRPSSVGLSACSQFQGYRCLAELRKERLLLG
jgi:hypothetical protein